MTWFYTQCCLQVREDCCTWEGRNMHTQVAKRKRLPPSCWSAYEGVLVYMLLRDSFLVFSGWRNHPTFFLSHWSRNIWLKKPNSLLLLVSSPLVFSSQSLLKQAVRHHNTCSSVTEKINEESSKEHPCPIGILTRNQSVWVTLDSAAILISI
jgi:hypothetical protein